MYLEDFKKIVFDNLEENGYQVKKEYDEENCMRYIVTKDGKIFVVYIGQRLKSYTIKDILNERTA